MTPVLPTRYGPWAVVTGASSGIGRAFATELAAAGRHVVLVARRAPELADLARALTARHGVDCRVVAADLAAPDGPAAVAGATAELDAGLLVAAAGFGTSGAWPAADLDTELAMLGVNCAASYALAHRFGTRFAERGRGGIVLVSSVVGYQGVPRAAHYAATKAYVHTLAEGMHAELRPRGVDVLAVAPGPVHTGFAAVAGMTLGRAARPEQVARAALAGLGRRAVVVPGAQAKLITAALATLPRWARVALMGRVMAGLTRPAVTAAGDRTAGSGRGTPAAT